MYPTAINVWLEHPAGVSFWLPDSYQGSNWRRKVIFSAAVGIPHPPALQLAQL